MFLLGQSHMSFIANVQGSFVILTIRYIITNWFPFSWIWNCCTSFDHQISPCSRIYNNSSQLKLVNLGDNSIHFACQGNFKNVNWWCCWCDGRCTCWQWCWICDEHHKIIVFHFKKNQTCDFSAHVRSFFAQLWGNFLNRFRRMELWWKWNASTVPLSLAGAMSSRVWSSEDMKCYFSLQTKNVFSWMKVDPISSKSIFG